MDRVTFCRVKQSKGGRYFRVAVTVAVTFGWSEKRYTVTVASDKADA